MVSHDLLPDLMILDPELVAEVPQVILKTSIADALSHATEGYVSKISHPMMEVFSEKSCEIIYTYHDKFDQENWDLEMISALQLSSMLAGIVQNHCVVGLSHAIAHSLFNYSSIY
ncbi:iron-containing alcohol dehydrogenase [Gammaproteobacteria bacterium]|nr:iron-containing alcohol dehydrogenase [Gammaproteobacteria bacterium]